jgi:hypothetical protein
MDEKHLDTEEDISFISNITVDESITTAKLDELINRTESAINGLLEHADIVKVTQPICSCLIDWLALGSSL